VNVTVNGERRELPEAATVEQAVAVSGAHESNGGVAVAVDGEVVPRRQWASTALRDGQRVEIVRAVQGG
jgi:sulfur carrier protein